MGALHSSVVPLKVVRSLSSSSSLNPPVSPRPPSSSSRGQRKSILLRFDPRLVLSSSAVLYREVKMFAIATAALIVFSVSAQAAKYDYGRDAYSEEPSYTYKQTTMYRPTYEYRYRRDVREEQQGECLRFCDSTCIENGISSEECSCEIVCTKR